VTLRKKPYLCSGWFWYVIALAPAIGLIQAGPQALADHFTYLPSIGVLIAVVWLIAELTDGHKRWRIGAGVLAMIWIVSLACASASQLCYWRDSVTLFSHAAEIAPGNAIIEHNLAYGLAESGRSAEAIPHYEMALALDSGLYRAHYNLGRALYEQGQLEPAIREFRETLNHNLSRDYEADVRNACGIALTRLGRMEAADSQFRTALNLKPESPEIHANRGSFLALAGNLQEAVNEYKAALRLSPGYTEAHLNLARALASLGHRRDAIDEVRAVLKNAPANGQAQALMTALSAADTN
jgi:Flp pilus assembly protein TadD